MDTQNKANGQGRDPYGGQQDARWELLSAYVDGEVSDAERATVETWLRADPAVREMLAELQELSETLRTLSTGIPHPDLRDATLQQITNLRPAAAALASVESRSWWPRWRRREFLAAGLGAAASVAVMLAIPWSDEVKTVHFGRLEHDFAMTARDQPMVRRELHPDNSFGASAARMSDEVPASPMLISSTGPQEAASGLMRKEMTRESTSGASLMPSAVADGVELEAAAAPIDALSRLEGWDDVQPYLGLVSQNTSAIANFDLVVLDVKQAADQFEVLLIQNGIPVVVEGHSATDSERTAAKSSTTKDAMSLADSDADLSESSLSAVYVEAEGEPITRALQELVRQRQVLSVKLQPPLQFDESGLLAAADSAPEQMQRARDLKLAYQNRNALSASRGDAPGGVSALEEVENRTSFEFQNNAAGMPSEKMGAAALSIEGRASRVPATAAAPLRRAPGDARAYDSPRSSGQAARGAIDPEAALVGNYGQRLNLPQPKQDWLQEVQREMKQQRLADDKAFQQQLAESERSGVNQLRSLQQSFQRSASNAVRVLFVMHPAADLQDASEKPASRTQPLAPAAQPAPPRKP